MPVALAEVEMKPLQECLDCFWQSGSKLDLLEIDPRAPQVENALLKRLGDAPFYIGKINMAALLAVAYSIAGKGALKRATEDESREPE